jgi:hypothetical protein
MSAAIVSPCDLATKAEVEYVLRGAAVDVPVSEIGEETAPYCLWTSARRDVRVKVAVWSKDEFPVLGLADAESHYRQMENLAGLFEEIIRLDGIGQRAFESAHEPETASARDATIVVLKADRTIVFEFTNVAPASARLFSARVSARL